MKGSGPGGRRGGCSFHIEGRLPEPRSPDRSRESLEVPGRSTRIRESRRTAGAGSSQLHLLATFHGSQVITGFLSITKHVKWSLRARHGIKSSHRGRANGREARREDEDVCGEYDESEQRSIAAVQPAECRGCFVAGPKPGIASGNRGLFQVLSRTMANKEQHKEKKKKKQPLKTKAEKRAERIAKKNSRK